MIDTIRLTSPRISMDKYDYFNNRLIMRLAVDMDNSTQLYKFTSGNLKGTWDSNISINLNREAYEYNDQLERPVKIKLDNEFTITLELSIQKFLDGHNIGKGYDDLEKPLKLLKNLIEGYFNIDLPDFKNWDINRIDIGFNFGLMPQAKKTLFETYSKLNYPRRKRYHYQGSGLYFKGTTTTVKIYDKGIEFRKHDLPKLKRILPHWAEEHFIYLRDYADSLIRFEVEIHNKKLKDIGIIKVDDFNKEILIEFYNKEVEKIMNIKNNEITNNSEEVLELLKIKETPRMARAVYSTWTMLSTMDIEKVLQNIPDRTLRRHKNIMKEHGISWINTDFEEMRKKLEKEKDRYNPLPIDFNFYYESKYRLKSIPSIKVAI